MAKNVQIKSDAREALGRVMRGESGSYGYLFSYLSSQDPMPKEHPLRAIKHHGDAALKVNPPQMIRHPH